MFVAETHRVLSVRFLSDVQLSFQFFFCSSRDEHIAIKILLLYIYPLTYAVVLNQNLSNRTLELAHHKILNDRFVSKYLV